jgi:O-antigen ligase/polysaccharide polymerase Wzy-like membrane protein
LQVFSIFSFRGRAAASLLRLLPAGAFVVCAALVAWRDYGSVDAADWLPYAVVLALVVAAVLLSGAALVPTRLGLVGALALAALAGWVALSIAWSPLPSLARDEALLTAFYGLALLTPLLTLAAPGERRGAAALVVAVLGFVTLATELRLRFGAHPADLYALGRLDSPVSYPNADAAFFLVAFWPAVGLAARRSWPVVARMASLAAATAFLAGWLLAQSKGGAFALVASALVFFALCPARLRALVPTLVAAALVGAAFRPLTAPYRVAEADLAATIRHAGAVALVLVAAAGALGLAYALVDRRIVVGPRAHRALGAATVVAALAALGGGAAAFATSVDRPGHWVADQWRSFKTLPAQQGGSTHLFALGSNRYDFWRVALHTFEDHPLGGVGGRGFRSVYLQDGRSVETPQRAHSVELDTLSENGIVGLVLLVVGIGLPLAVVLVRARRSVTAAAAAAAAVYWLAHSTVDWTWTFPAVTVPALLLLGIGAAPDSRRPLSGRVGVPAGIAAVFLALFAFAPPWLSARYSDRAYGDADRAASDLRWAKRLDPLAPAPYEAQAALASSPKDIPPLQAAVRKEPRRVELRYALALAYLRADRRAAARRELRAALELYPRSDDLRRALRRAG